MRDRFGSFKQPKDWEEVEECEEYFEDKVTDPPTGRFAFTRHNGPEDEPEKVLPVQQEKPKSRRLRCGAIRIN